MRLRTVSVLFVIGLFLASSMDSGGSSDTTEKTKKEAVSEHALQHTNPK